MNMELPSVTPDEVTREKSEVHESSAPLTREEVEAFLARDAAESAPLKERLVAGTRKFVEQQLPLVKEYLPVTVATAVMGAILPGQEAWMLENIPDSVIRFFQFTGPSDVTAVAQIGVFLLYAGAMKAWPLVRAFVADFSATHGQPSPETP